MSFTDVICPPDTAFAAAVAAVRAGERDVDAAVTDLVGRLTDPELLWLLDGDLTVRRGLREMSDRYNKVPFQAGRIERLGIPGIRFTDGPRGVALGASTAFPVAIARAATWDPAVETSVADAIGAEARAQGANLWAGICLNLAYAPGWGRAQESYGEDPVLLGAMGAAAVQGANPWVLSCAKHFALNSMEEARFRVDVRVAEDVLREVFLPHFRTVVEAGVDCVMSAYNSVNGSWAGQNRHLLTDILRGDWGFTGFVMTDFIWGLRDPIGSVAGQSFSTHGTPTSRPCCWPGIPEWRAVMRSPTFYSGTPNRPDGCPWRSRTGKPTCRKWIGAPPPSPTAGGGVSANSTATGSPRRIRSVSVWATPLSPWPTLRSASLVVKNSAPRSPWPTWGPAPGVMSFRSTFCRPRYPWSQGPASGWWSIARSVLSSVGPVTVSR